MRVLHVYRTFFPDTQGGLEEVIRQICKNTQAHGVESRVFCLSHQPEPAIVEYDGITVYRAKCTLEIASCDISLSALGYSKTWCSGQIWCITNFLGRLRTCYILPHESRSRPC